MPVVQLVRPEPSRSSDTRSAVSVLVRATYAVRPSAGAQRPEREEDVVSREAAKRDPDAAAHHAYDDPAPRACAERLVGAEEDEIAVPSGSRDPPRRERCTRSRSAIVSVTSTRGSRRPQRRSGRPDR